MLTLFGCLPCVSVLITVFSSQQIQLLPTTAESVWISQGDQGAGCGGVHASLLPEGPPGSARGGQKRQSEATEELDFSLKRVRVT